MKKTSVFLFWLMFLLVSGNCFASSKNVFKQIFKIYKDYQEINMLLWLSGDVGAEKRLGKELALWQKLMSREEKDPKRVERVRRIFKKLAPQYNTPGMKLRCHVLHDKTINAFAIPGGYIYVYSGIIDFLQSDDELAAVIAHELAHVERRHSLKNFRSSIALTALLKKAIKNKNDRNTWGALLSAFALMNFSRKQEDEADDVGQYRLVKAGFNPYGQVNVWERFMKRFGDSSGIQRYLSSHPSHQSRIDNAKRNIMKMNWQPPVAEEIPATQAPNSGNLGVGIEEPAPSPRENVKNQERKDTKPSVIESAKIGNLISNSGFEDGYNSNGQLNSWQVVEGQFRLSNADVFQGSYSLEGTAEGSFTKGRILSDYIAVDEKSDLNFTALVKSENGTQVGAFAIELYNSSKRLRNRIWIKESMALPKEWNRFTARLVNNETGKIFSFNTAYIRILLQVGPGSNGKIWFDELCLTKN